MNILFLCFRKRAYKPSFPESFGNGSCSWGLLLWAAKLFLLESHRSVWIVRVCTVVKETTQLTPSPAPPCSPCLWPPRVLWTSHSQAVGPARVRCNWSFSSHQCGLGLTQTLPFPEHPLKKIFFKTLCVFHGKFHTPVSDSFSIKGSKYWFCKSPLMIPNFVGSFFLSS